MPNCVFEIFMFSISLSTVVWACFEKNLILDGFEVFRANLIRQIGRMSNIDFNDVSYHPRAIICMSQKQESWWKKRVNELNTWTFETFPFVEPQHLYWGSLGQWGAMSFLGNPQYEFPNDKNRTWFLNPNNARSVHDVARFFMFQFEYQPHLYSHASSTS